MPEPDNYTRARNAQTAAIDAANRGRHQLAEHMTSLASSAATLALVDAQREANEQARIANLLAYLNYSDGDSYAPLLGRIEEGLGLA